MHSLLRDRLKLARRAQRYSQRQLAEAAGLSRLTVSLLETSPKHDPRFSALQQLATVLGDPHLFCGVPADCVERAS